MRSEWRQMIDRMKSCNRGVRLKFSYWLTTTFYRPDKKQSVDDDSFYCDADPPHRPSRRVHQHTFQKVKRTPPDTTRIITNDIESVYNSMICNESSMDDSIRFARRPPLPPPKQPPVPPLPPRPYRPKTKVASPHLVTKQTSKSVTNKLDFSAPLCRSNLKNNELEYRECAFEYDDDDDDDYNQQQEQHSRKSEQEGEVYYEPDRCMRY